MSTGKEKRRKGAVKRGRLDAAGMELLRRAAYERSGETCEMQRDGKRCGWPICWWNFDLAHIVSRGAGGADSLDNVLCSCKWRADGKPGCHTLSHNKERKMPKRIQRKRTKGWRCPKGAVYVGRPSLLGNPFSVKDWGQEGAVLAFRLYLEHNYAGKALATFAEEYLRGKDLMCWCPLDQPCHADVLLELANRDPNPP